MDSLSSDLMDLSTLLRQVLRYRIAEQPNKVIRKRNVYIAAWSRGATATTLFLALTLGAHVTKVPERPGTWVMC